ncbi:MAG: hypothetical protein IKX76_02590 [Eubacterium sp.]|nr:hypothetical protein [Eubacterium sp.]
MNRNMKKSVRYMLLVAAALLVMILPAVSARAKATDEIQDFTITVDVNEDASLQMTYHIDWKVLDDSIGKLEWIDLGVPNSHHEDITPLSDTIDHINDKASNLAIYLDRAYGEGETVSLDFSMKQDNMYQIDKYTEGETVYSFTPAWFDTMEVDRLTIRWNAENAASWQPDCQQEDGYLTFRTSLSEGERFTMSVTYPNDAFAFAEDRQAGNSSNNGYSGTDGEEEYSFWEVIGGMIVLIICLLIMASPFIFLYKLIKWIAGGLGFGSRQETKKKITRTKIEYYDNCPSCGAAREEGKDSCQYCGRSMIKSKEIVEESQIENPEKYTKNGTYRYGNSGNTYIHVNVVNVPVSRPRSTSHSSRSGGSGGSSRHSCACVSSCACASHCACACACASSGRAGCSVKDFYKDSIHKGRILIESKRKNREKA